MNQRLNEAIELFRNYKLDEALVVLDQLIQTEPLNINVLLLLGKLHARTQKYGEAINYFQNALEIEPNNTEANTGLKLIKNILQLTNNYYYENPYTDDDLYDFEK